MSSLWVPRSWLSGVRRGRSVSLASSTGECPPRQVCPLSAGCRWGQSSCRWTLRSAPSSSPASPAPSPPVWGCRGSRSPPCAAPLSGVAVNIWKETELTCFKVAETYLNSEGLWLYHDLVLFWNRKYIHPPGSRCMACGDERRKRRGWRSWSAERHRMPGWRSGFYYLLVSWIKKTKVLLLRLR